MRVYFVVCAFLATALSLAQCADPLGPGKGAWLEETPEQHGLDPGLLESGKEFLFKKTPTRNCLVVVKDGALVYEAYGGLFSSRSTPHTGYSMTKTLGALIVGSAVGKGQLDIDADVTAAYGVKSQRPYNTTSRHIMSQALDGKHGPGEAWAYDALGTRWVNSLTSVVKAAAGEKPSTIWQREFHEPLGLQSSFKMEGIDEVFAAGSSGTCVDYARIGQLMLNNGRWPGVNGTIVPSDYVRQLTTPATKFAPYQTYSNPGYGLLTWLNTRMNETGSYPGISKICTNSPVPPADQFPAGLSKQIYFLGGALGQIVMVLPEDNMVAVTMGTSLSDLGGFTIATALTELLCPLLESCNSTASQALHV